MTTILSDWAGCTALAGENNYSRSPSTGSYPGSSKKEGVNTSELQGICNPMALMPDYCLGVNTSELQGICNMLSHHVCWPSGVNTSELDI